ncbi:response regulator transcription factor [Paenibacillus sp. CECT 9249]|uniref:response regulator transcription factor n=1 Tax=unclassified Paenibacillus TaxID=185978 RepID=UPI001C125AEC|nr:response regulator transcription factor [Paenibacillus sp. CECT 9249]MBU5445089.1 response regulator transcription factor [Paenibacillus sp. MSJ-34]CAH0122390.1 Sensory transduction protein regX3 [Paenibacillus sp. CECT 9249]
MGSGTVLLVDDEQGLLDLLAFTLRKFGIANLLTATTAQEALEIIARHDVSLIVLDVMLPDGDGFEVCQQIRKITEAPVLFLTAKNQDIHKIKGFELGADDYITKPFNPTEVAARVQVHLRRMAKLQTMSKAVYDFGHFALNKQSGQLFVQGREVPCAPMEFLLLAFLCEHPNFIFTVSELYEKVWRPYQEGDEKTVVIHISRIRKKIEPDPRQPQFLVNMKGLGYKLVKKARYVP